MRNRRYFLIGGGASLLATMVSPGAASAQEVEAAVASQEMFTINNTWMLVATFLVFIMHLGFACLECGLTQSKNTVNILFKNTAVVAIGLVTYAFAGFNLMYPNEFGVEPGLDIIESVASVSFPASVGLSLSNYYENGISTDTPFGFGDNFGHFGVGAAVAVPLGMPKEYGSWELTGGSYLVSLGSYLESINDGDSVQAVGSIGFSIGY
jgi:hypothetical protein